MTHAKEVIEPGRPVPPEPFALPPLHTQEGTDEIGEVLLHLSHLYPPVVSAEFDSKERAEQVVAYAQTLNLSHPDAVLLYEVPKVRSAQPKLSLWQRVRNALIGPPPLVEMPPDEIRYRVVIKLDHDDQIAALEDECRQAGALSIQTRPARRLKA